MAGVKSLIALALAGSAGMTLLILACTLSREMNWWPAIVIVFYLLVPFPILIAQRLPSDGDFGGQSSAPKEWAYFLTTGIVTSALALPIVMCGVGTIHVSATLLSLLSSVFFFATILAFSIVFQSEDNYMSGIY